MCEMGGSRLDAPTLDCRVGLGLLVWDPADRGFSISQRSLGGAELISAFGIKGQYIGQAETVAAGGAYWTAPKVFGGRRVIHFVDNQGALSALVRACSRDPDTSAIAHLVAKRHLELNCQVWFEFVNSAANIADLPSRGELARAARMLREAFRHPVWWREMKLPPFRDLA